MKIVTKSLINAFKKVEKIKGKEIYYSLQVINGKLYLVKNTFDNQSKPLNVKVMVECEEPKESIALTQSILKTVKNIKEDIINIDVEEKILKTNERKINITNNEPIFELHNMETVKDNISLSIGEYKTLLDTVDFVSKEEVRPILQYVNFKNNILCSLDGYRLCTRKSDNFNLQGNYNVLGTVLKQTLGLISKDTKNINIKFNDEYCSIVIDNAEVVTTLSDCDYINYEQLLGNTEYTTIVEFDEKEIIEEVDFLKSISDNTSTKKLVVLDINEYCKLYDSYKNEVNIEKYNKSGEYIKIGLNYNYFLDVLKHTKSDKITCKFINPHNLITLEDKEINGCNYFLPVRLD